ncbi:MAG TPA: hypothetical protein VMR43_10010, partial [Variovorax sp.]|nr:hypothetical protein [Variovorax sp.]
MNTVRLQTSIHESPAALSIEKTGKRRSSRTVDGVPQAALIAFPFLSPFVAGPSVNVWQLLGAWVCVAALVLLADRSHARMPARALLCWFGVVLGALAWRHGRDPVLFLGAEGAVVAAALAACVGAFP